MYYNPKKKIISFFKPHYAHNRGQAIANTRNETKKMMEVQKYVPTT
jgi:hypothetical protein